MKAHVDEVRDKAQRKITETVQKMAAQFEQERKVCGFIYCDKERYKQQVLDATKTNAILFTCMKTATKMEQIEKEYDDKVVARNWLIRKS